MQRLRQVAEERQHEAEALRERLSRRSAAALRASGECNQGAAAAAIAAATLRVPAAAQGGRAAAVRRRDADMEGDVVLQRSMESSHSAGSSTGAPAEPLPLQPAQANMAPHGERTRRQPKQQQPALAFEDGGWGSDYLHRFRVGKAAAGSSACLAELCVDA